MKFGCLSLVHFVVAVVFRGEWGGGGGRCFCITPYCYRLYIAIQNGCFLSTEVSSVRKHAVLSGQVNAKLSPSNLGCSTPLY